jgi:hypothetical protein
MTVKPNMKNKSIETQEKLPEDEDDRELQRKVKESFKRWGRASCYLGLALVVSITLVVPFLYGNPLHRLWNTFGVGLVVVSMGLLLASLYAAANTLNLWLYGANLRKIDRDFASGKSGKWRK